MARNCNEWQCFWPYLYYTIRVGANGANSNPVLKVKLKGSLVIEYFWMWNGKGILALFILNVPLQGFDLLDNRIHR